MIDLKSLIAETVAYKSVMAEKKNDKLSHAYLITTADRHKMQDYLKIFAKLIMCEGSPSCDNCRACRLIDDNAHPDVISYPKGEKDVVVDDIANLIEESIIKPLESDRKLFIINHADKMNTRAQNKLLKTLEEPPQNVCILLGATTDFALLPTVKSRVKQLRISPFSNEKIYDALSAECKDADKLNSAISCGDGTVGTALALYNDENLAECIEVAESVLCDMQSSKDVLEFSGRVAKLKCDFTQFLSVLELLARDLLCYKQGKVNLVENRKSLVKTSVAEGYSVGAIIYIQDKIVQASKRKKSNANSQMLIEWLLFQILEGKYKWRKL